MRKVLIIGRGGREHALAWKFSESAEVYVAPGCDGMEKVAKRVPIDENDFQSLIDFAKDEDINLTVIGPEVPLVNGIVNRFQMARLNVWGPKAEAAMIEGSKSFAKDFMHRHNIPTGFYTVFSNYESACRYVETVQMPIVIKADGLASGKGVIIAHDKTEAKEALAEMLEGAAFGQAGKTVVIEEFLEGEEFSFIALVARERVIPLALSQDHKRAYDNDEGPNTGGMGAYSPVPQIDEATIQIALDEIMIPTARYLAKEERLFTGFLYGGLIATEEGPKVIEFNARLGDPEAQVLLTRLENDLFDVIMAMLRGEEIELKWSDDAVVGVVMAANGYPGPCESGLSIEGLDGLDSMVFRGSGGRALLVAGKGKDIASAKEAAYNDVKKIKCDKLFYRTDIGCKGIK